MASKNEAKVIFKAVVDQFEQGIEQAKTSVTGLNAQLRLNSQEMTKNGTSTQLLSQRVDLLTSKQREQQAVVGGLENKLEAARFVYGENSTEVKKLENQLTNAKATLQSYANQTEQARQKLAQSKTEYGQTTQAIKLQEAELKQLKQEYANVVVAEGRNSDSARELEAKIRGLSTELGQNKERLQLADDAADKLGDSYRTAAQKADAFKEATQKVGQGMQAVGRGLTVGVTMPVVAAGAATVKAAVDIDTALTGVRKTVDGTEEQYQQLKQAAIDFSLTNAVEPSQILDIQALGAQLGFAIEELDEFGQVVSGLDIATNMDADQAATEMAQFANITKMSHEEISNYGSAIVGLGNNFATTESDISSMAMRLAASGTQVGMSQADILGLATALSSMGVEAEAGGTAISTIMAQIDKDIALAGEAMAGTTGMTQKEIDKVNGALETWASTAGMSAQEFSDAWRNDPVQALSALLSNMEATTAEGGNMSVMLQDLGIDSIRQADVMKRLGGNSQFVADAVSKANAEWSANTALSKEVDNRNQSLAAQFDMLKNRVTAVADDVGGPLAAALLDVVECAEPLIKAIADGAKQFSEMSEGEQRAVLQAVALSAAIGPVLNLFGKGVRNIETFGSVLQKVSKFFATVDQNTSQAGRSIKGYTAETKASETAVKKHADTVKMSSVAMGAAKTAAMGLAAAFVGSLVMAVIDFAREMGEAEKRSKEMKAANERLSSSLDGLHSGTSSASASLKELGATAADVKGKADELAQAHADLADSLADTMNEAGSSAGMLGHYMDTIHELGTKSNLTAGEQALLKDALDNVNEACGTSFQMTNDANGALYGQVDAIQAVVAAQQERLRYEAASQGLKDLYQDEAESLMEIARLESERDALTEKMKGKKVSECHEEAEAYTQVIDALDEERAHHDATNDAIKRYSDYLAELGSQIGSTKEDIAGFIASNGELSQALSDSGVDADALSQALSQCGISTSDLSAKSAEELSAMLSSFDGNLSSIVGMCDAYGIEIPGKIADGIYEGSGQVTFAAGSIGEKVISELTGKDYSQTGVTVDQGMAEGMGDGLEAALAAAGLGDEVIKAIMEALDAHSPSRRAKEAGETVPAGLAEGINGSSEPGSAAATLGDMVVDALGQAVEGAFGIGEATGSEYASGVGSQTGSAQGSGAGVAGGATSGLWTGDASGGSALGAAFASLLGDQYGNALAQATGVASGATSGLGTGDASPGSKLGGEYASGVGGHAGNARSQGGAVASAAGGGLRSQNDNASSWGGHLVQNFAAGIRGMIDFVAGAANAVASTVAGILGHTVPKEGVLREGGKGEAVWGEHLVRNIATGMRNARPEIDAEADAIAASLADIARTSAVIDFSGGGAFGSPLEISMRGKVDSSAMRKTLNDELNMRVQDSRRIEAATSAAVINDRSADRIVSAIEKQNESISKMRIDLDGKSVGTIATPFVDRAMSVSSARKDGGF